MSNSDIPVLKFQFREDFKPLEDSLNIQPGYDVEDFNSGNDMATFLSTTNAGLIIASLKTRDDLMKLAAFMKVVKKVAKDTTVKVVVVNFSNDKNFEWAVTKIGIQDFVDPFINTKSFKLKLDFWMKSLEGHLKNNPSKDSKVINTNEAGKSGEEPKCPDLSAPQWIDPLDLENDIWLVQHETDAKKVLSKWLVRLLGPSPYVGQWVEVKGGLWRFDLKESERDIYLSGEGAWIFSGDQKPEFVWEENTWLITGDTFDLYFRDSNTIQSRLKAKDKILTVCKNSMFAKTKEQMIIESCDKDLIFKLEAESLSDIEWKNKTDQINSGSLQNKSKTDQAGGDNLEGKNKTELLNGGNLKGKTKTGSDKSENLSGKLESSERINNEDLYQKTKTSKESSSWNDKNAYQKEEGKADFGIETDEPRAGALLELELKDQEHQKHYKNHNEAQEYNLESLDEGNVSNKSSTGSAEEEREGEEENSSYNDFNELIRKNRPEEVKVAANSNPRPEYDEETEGSLVVSLNRMRDEKDEAPEQARIDEISQDAKVISFILSQSQKIDCNLDDFFEDTIVFSIFENSISENDLRKDSKVTLNMAFKFLHKDTTLNMEGDIKSVEGIGEGTSFVNVTISKANVDAFNSFMKLFEVRQKHINEFLLKAKGVA